MPQATTLSICFVPVARVGDDCLGWIGDAGPLELAGGRLDHRLELAEVGRLDSDLGGDDDQVL
jgi:hypothetical protein